MKTVVARLFVP